MMGGREVVVEFVEGEEADEIERFVEQQQSIIEQKAKQKKERRVEINRKIAEKMKAMNRNKNQLSLLEDL